MIVARYEVLLRLTADEEPVDPEVIRRLLLRYLYELSEGSDVVVRFAQEEDTSPDDQYLRGQHDLAESGERGLEIGEIRRGDEVEGA